MLLVLALVIGLLGAVPVWAEDIPDVTDYSYTVTPILSPFAYYLYVKTDNPDPTSFRLVDKESRFYDDDSQGEIYVSTEYGYSYYVNVDPGTYYISQNIYADVVYEDESTYRVPGGYIFRADGAFSDGGEFVLLQKTFSGSSILQDKFEPTDVTIPCQALNTRVGYLIDTCTTEEMSFFEKLDAVQARLDQIAVYPRDVYDVDDPNEDRPYPLLAASPYPELILNEHYNMFNLLEGGILASDAYPFVLHSTSFPGTIWAVAEQLEPDCEVASTGLHYLIDITFAGETRTYGGAGAGGNDPLYSNRVEQVFTFSGEDDFGTHGTLEGYYTLLRGYEPVAEADAEAYRDLISGDTFHQTIRATGGTWIRIATEGFLGLGASCGYVGPLGDDTMSLSDAWVDGRYISNHETIILNEKFEDHPTADIVLHNVTYTDINGQTHTQDVVYSYDAAKDAWTAPYFYSNAFSYSSGWQLPEELILTREEVAALELDSNSSHLPASGLVYDGKEKPGTPFNLKLVTGISVPETLELYVGQRKTIEVAVEPADAFDNSVRWTSSDPAVAEVLDSSTSLIQGVKAGTAVLTAVTVDGGYTASCTVTVLPDPCADGHSYTPTVTAPTCTDWGYTTYTCSFCGDSYVDAYVSPLGHAWDSGKVTTQPTETTEGVKTFTCTRCGVTSTESIPASGEQPDKPDQPDQPDQPDKPCDGGVDCPSGKFVDVSTKDWFHAAVDFTVERGLFGGTSANTFEPDTPMTRAMLVTVLWRYEREPAAPANTFSDVKAGAWYFDAVSWAAANGVVDGVGNNKFDPDGNITREQMATIFYRYCNWKGIDTGKQTSLGGFPDAGKVSSYAKTALQWTVAEGLVGGSDGKLLPQGSATRAQVATILMRFIEKVVEQPTMAAPSDLNMYMFGNSILYHGQSEGVGWFGNWGMAASSAEKDYAHRLNARLAEKYGEVSYATSTIVAYETAIVAQDHADYSAALTSYTEQFRAYCAEDMPEIVTIQMGENVSDIDLSASQYKNAVMQLISMVRTYAPDCGIVLCTPFWGGDAKITAVEQIAAEADNVQIARLDTLNTDENKAIGLFEHAGVAAHPNDAGMEKIAALIFNAMEPLIAEKVQPHEQS